MSRFDPATGYIVAGPYDIPSTGDTLAVGEGGVWLLDPQGRELRRLDPSSGDVTDVSIEQDRQSTPIALIVSPGSVWILTYEHELLRVDVG